MAFADIGDRLLAQASEEFALRVRGPFSRGLDPGESNLVVRAIRAFGAEVRRPLSPLGFTLDKQIPVASGLGGGSSDAGAALRLLRDDLAANFPDERLEAIAAALGADGSACLWGRPVIAEGRGERLSPAPALPRLDAVLVNPRVAVSTSEVYRRLDESANFGDVRPPPMPDAFEDVHEVAAWLATQRNDLEAPAIEVCPEVGAVLATLRDEPEALIARVSGSGGTCFALCDDDIAAESLAERIEGLAPSWWVRRCRLGGPWD